MKLCLAEEASDKEEDLEMEIWANLACRAGVVERMFEMFSCSETRDMFRWVASEFFSLGSCWYTYVKKMCGMFFELKGWRPAMAAIDEQGKERGERDCDWFISMRWEMVGEFDFSIDKRNDITSLIALLLWVGWERRKEKSKTGSLHLFASIFMFRARAKAIFTLHPLSPLPLLV